jgi:hypothetical protein
MKRATRTKERTELRKEYRLDYRKARLNRFAGRMAGASVAVVLDPDVATVFRTSKAVNSVLRSFISAKPGRSGSRSVPKRRAV